MSTSTISIMTTPHSYGHYGYYTTMSYKDQGITILIGLAGFAFILTCGFLFSQLVNLIRGNKDYDYIGFMVGSFFGLACIALFMTML